MKKLLIPIVALVALASTAFAQNVDPVGDLSYTIVYSTATKKFQPGTTIKLADIREVPLFGNLELTQLFALNVDGTNVRLGLALTKSFAMGPDLTLGASLGFSVADGDKSSVFFGLSGRVRR